MTALAQHPYAQALAWTLVNFLWQGAAIAAAAFLLLRLARDRATWQYAIGVAALGLMLVAPVATYAVLASGSTPVVSSAVGAPDAAVANSALLSTNQPSVSLGPAALPSVPTYQVLVIGLWLTGVSVLSLRLLGGWMVARRLTRRSTRPVGPEILALAERAAARLRLARVVSILESSLVSVPMIVGWMKPAVLLPAAALSGLAPDQIEALLAHELAHVRRHDYLVNLLQSGVETLLFYHPAVWWLSGQVREAREHCCDDLAVAASDRLVYATALADLASIVATPRLALAATDGSLVARVRRILSGSSATPRTSLGWMPICAVLCVIGALVPSGFVSAAGKSAAPAAAVVEPSAQDTPVETPRQVSAPRANRAEAQVVEEVAAQERERIVLAEGAQKEKLTAEALAELKRQIELAQRQVEDAKVRVEIGTESQDQMNAAIQKLNEVMRELKMRKEMEPEQLVSADQEIAKIKQDQMKREYERMVQLYQKGLVTRDAMAQAEAKLKLEQLEDEKRAKSFDDALDDLARTQESRNKAIDEALANLARTQKLFEVGLVTKAELNDAMTAAKNRHEQTDEALRKALADAEWSRSAFAKIQGEPVETDLGPLSSQAMALRDRLAFDGTPMSNDALGAVLKDAARLDSDVDRAAVLIAVSDRQALTAELVTLYATAAKAIKSDEIRAKVFAHPIRLKQVR